MFGGGGGVGILFESRIMGVEVIGEWWVRVIECGFVFLGFVWYFLEVGSRD